MQNQPTYNTPNPNPAPAGSPPDPLQDSQMFQDSQAATAYAAQPGAAVGYQPAPGFAPNGNGTAPLIAPPTAAPYDPYASKSKRNVVEIIILVLISLIAVVFIGLFIWKYLEWDTIKTDVDGQIEAAVAVAVADNTTRLEEEFLEREKYPYKTFSGPVDYGSLSFEFPKTWNTYIYADAANGGDFEAYLNPGEIPPLSSNTVFALHVEIVNQSFESIARAYEGYVQSGQLSITTRTVGNTVGNVYVGTLPNGFHGVVTIFKVRDKTIVLQTDADLFAEEYYTLLDTVTFIE